MLLRTFDAQKMVGAVLPHIASASAWILSEGICPSWSVLILGIDSTIKTTEIVWLVVAGLTLRMGSRSMYKP